MNETDPRGSWLGSHDYTARVALAQHIADGLRDDEPCDGFPLDA
jgi:hypothetical protein